MTGKTTIIMLIITLLVLLFIALILVILQPNLTGNVVTNQDDYRTFTKAVCNSTNYCQDYVYTCKNKETISIQPITGAAIQLPEGSIPRTSNISCDS